LKGGDIQNNKRQKRTVARQTHFGGGRRDTGDTLVKSTWHTTGKRKKNKRAQKGVKSDREGKGKKKDKDTMFKLKTTLRGKQEGGGVGYGLDTVTKKKKEKKEKSEKTGGKGY